jgi:hypothetical protein
VSDLFLKSNVALDKVVVEATNTEQMREALKAELARQGVIARDTDFGARVIGQPEPTPSFPVSAEGRVRDDHMCERVLYPHNNLRLVIVGPSEVNLDQQEAAIRAAFNRQR